ncbi:hypothetical protein BDB00DRAFT_805773 [Zychaea mexicana]|uniref:uncharacterized protein n=1 Tax=Zychaea mexicana TaxID=64656 RepID=UPI0022FE5BC2|nr:uncharacterized protein BDB00DRAFT_805773 [Zychaea mexicana]KAI9497276.1 hypothetical protein BDB00DRAFT_805773 [Zychaea mexicana]
MVVVVIVVVQPKKRVHADQFTIFESLFWTSCRPRLSFFISCFACCCCFFFQTTQEQKRPFFFFSFRPSTNTHTRTPSFSCCSLSCLFATLSFLFPFL